MKIKIRRQYVLEGLEDRFEVLQKKLKNNFGIAKSEDEIAVLCGVMNCNKCEYFNEDYPCKTQEVLELAHLITMLRDSKEEYIEIEIQEKNGVGEII